MTNQIPGPRHQANIDAKAGRGIIAIDSLIMTRLIDDTAFPEITDLDSGRVFMLACLKGDDRPIEQYAAMWVAVGIEHDRLAGIRSYRNGERPTLFDSSREILLGKLDALVWIADHPAPVDPFQDLNGHVADPF